MASAEGMMFNGAQTGNMVDSTTGAGQSSGLRGAAPCGNGKRSVARHDRIQE